MLITPLQCALQFLFENAKLKTNDKFYSNFAKKNYADRVHYICEEKFKELSKIYSDYLVKQSILINMG